VRKSILFSEIDGGCISNFTVSQLKNGEVHLLNPLSMQIKGFKTFKNLTAIILSLFSVNNAKSQNIISEKYLDSLIEHHVEQSKIAGIAGAVIVNKKIVWLKGYGYADKENKIAFTANTIMNAGSIAKTFTGVCMMKLVEENKLSLDEDINQYLPFKVKNPHYPSEKITLRMIATHSSSLADRAPFYSENCYIYGSDAKESLGEFLKNYFSPAGKYYADSNFYKARPGTYWEYSNIATALAGYIVELKSGMMLNEYCRKVIFKPLGMTTSGWFLREVTMNKHAKLYKNKGDSTIAIPLYGFITYPDGGLRTSVAELSRFFIALLNDGMYNKKRILKKETLMEMQRLQFTTTKKPENILLAEKNEGIFWRTKNNVTKFGHGGNDPGLKALMLTDINKEVGVILLTNTQDDNGKRTSSYYGIFDELFKYGLSLNLKNKK
jgi:CubicO group peptidase (beta-lactamase class C family)